MFTDENKIEFEKWFRTSNYISEFTLLDYVYESLGHSEGICFYKLPFSMKQGVYLEYLDSVGMEVDTWKSKSTKAWHFLVNDNDDNASTQHQTRQEALKEAIKKSDEIINKQLNKI